MHMRGIGRKGINPKTLAGSGVEPHSKLSELKKKIDYWTEVVPRAN